MIPYHWHITVFLRGGKGGQYMTTKDVQSATDRAHRAAVLSAKYNVLSYALSYQPRTGSV